MDQFWGKSVVQQYSRSCGKLFKIEAYITFPCISLFILGTRQEWISFGGTVLYSNIPGSCGKLFKVEAYITFPCILLFILGRRQERISFGGTVILYK